MQIAGLHSHKAARDVMYDIFINQRLNKKFLINRVYYKKIGKGVTAPFVLCFGDELI